MKAATTRALILAHWIQICGLETPAYSADRQSHTLGSTSISLSRPTAESPDVALISFDKDVRANGNILPGGTYEIRVQQVAEDDAHVIFKQEIVKEGNGPKETKERLRIAVRPTANPSVDQLTLMLEVIPPEAPRESRRRSRRRRPRPAVANLNLAWDDQVVSIELVMTGILWRDTAPPPVPEFIQAPWQVVLSSLKGLANQSWEQHSEHFADNFESDWDDGGSEEAHAQFIGRMLFDGAFESSVLQLDQLEWTEENKDQVHFRGMTILGDFGRAALEYRTVNTAQGWKVVHLDGPKEE